MRTGFTLCLAENNPNVEGGQGKQWGGPKKTPVLNSLMGAPRPEAGGGGGWSSEVICNQLVGTVSAGGWGGATGQGA